MKLMVMYSKDGFWPCASFSWSSSFFILDPDLAVWKTPVGGLTLGFEKSTLGWELDTGTV